MLNIFFKKTRAYIQEINMSSIDCKKAFNYVDYVKLWNVFKKIGIPLSCETYTYDRKLQSGQNIVKRDVGKDHEDTESLCLVGSIVNSKE